MTQHPLFPDLSGLPSPSPADARTLLRLLTELPRVIRFDYDGTLPDPNLREGFAGWVSPMVSIPAAPAFLVRRCYDHALDNDERSRARGFLRHLGAHPELPAVAVQVLQASTRRMLHRGAAPALLAMLPELSIAMADAIAMYETALDVSNNHIGTLAAVSAMRFVAAHDDLPLVSLTEHAYAHLRELGFEKRMQGLLAVAASRNAWQIPSIREAIITHAAGYLEMALVAMPRLAEDPAAAVRVLRSWSLQSPRAEGIGLLHAATQYSVHGYTIEQAMQMVTSDDPVMRELGMAVAGLLAPSEHQPSEEPSRPTLPSASRDQHEPRTP